MIYVGKYVTEEIRSSRNLPPNPACSRRMERISALLNSCGFDVIILSQGNNLNMRANMFKFHTIRRQKIEKISIIYCPTISIPYFVGLWNVLVFPLFFLKYLLDCKDNQVVFYNFYPSYILPCLISRLIGKEPILDLEDISDFRNLMRSKKSLREVLEQGIGYLSMKAMLGIVQSVIIPTKRFVRYIPEGKKHIIISGCLNVQKRLTWPEFKNAKLRVLLSGKLSQEHGLSLVADLLGNPDYSTELLRKFVFEICGRGVENDKLIEKIANISNPGVLYHGFLNDEEYGDVLKRAHVGLVLQDPHGENSQRKTPSKGYEYLSNCKALVVTDIGDFTELPHSCKINLKEYTSEGLYKLLMHSTPENLKDIAENGYQFSKENYDVPVLINQLRAFI